MMFKKTYGLVYRNRKWTVRNYGRVLKKGGMTWGNAKIGAWWRNRKGETPIIELKRVVPRPGPPEEYGPQPGDLAGTAFLRTFIETDLGRLILVAFKDASPFIKVSWKEPDQ
jgi:hypothetical protein